MLGKENEEHKSDFTFNKSKSKCFTNEGEFYF